MSEQSQQNKKTQPLDNENVRSESSIKANFQTKKDQKPVEESPSDEKEVPQDPNKPNDGRKPIKTPDKPGYKKSTSKDQEPDKESQSDEKEVSQDPNKQIDGRKPKGKPDQPGHKKPTGKDQKPDEESPSDEKDDPQDPNKPNDRRKPIRTPDKPGHKKPTGKDQNTVEESPSDEKETKENAGNNLEQSVEPQNTVVEEKEHCVAVEEEEVEKNAWTQQSPLPEETMQRSLAEKSACTERVNKTVMEQSGLLDDMENSALPVTVEKSALPEEVEKSALPEEVEKNALAEESTLKNIFMLLERVKHAVVEMLWTRGGAALIVLIAIAVALCANHFCGTQTFESRSALQIFQDEFKRLQKEFPEQNHKLWLRSGKMLTNHLNKSNPDEPAMIILTAAQDAKHTLQCLGSGLAQTYAFAFNSSWLLIHGPSQSEFDASTAKLHIDERLSSGFEAEHRAAVLNRLETLPPGSLLILYKYCDHENAAYKNVALVFTVLLEDSSLEPDTPLPDLEEKVRDFLWQKFIHPGAIRSHQEMDSDKLSGVWSRISHLVLPVLPVKRIEAGNCPFSHE